MNNDFLLSVDWGTSNFRLRLVERSSVRVLDELVSSSGVQTIFANWQLEGGDRETMFLGFLKQHIAQLNKPVPEETEIIISGMASSRIGIRELPYSTLPFQLNGSGLQVSIIKHALFPNGVKLISGVCAEADVMRGEETQVVGLANEAAPGGKTVLIFPGTHSKHILCENGVVTGFNTFMTGELFDILCNHGLLKGSVEQPVPGFMDFKNFDEGVLISNDKPSLLENLFKIRAGNLLGLRSTTENYFYLSGLLIGEEISTLTSKYHEQILLCAGSNLYPFYKRAIEVLGLSGNTNIVSEEKVAGSVVTGQLKITGQNS